MSYAKRKLNIAEKDGAGIISRMIELGDVVGLTPSIEASMSTLLVTQNEKLLV